MLSYRYMFLICSLLIRSNGAKYDMIVANRFASMTIALAGLIVTSFHPVNAHEFALFEHVTLQPKVEAEKVRHYLPATSVQGKTDISYKEKLYMGEIAKAERRYGLPQNLLRALIWAESRFNPMAVSSAGAAGLAQLMPATARELGVRNRHDPIASIDGGARYLRDMLKRFKAVHLALAAYNAGPNAVSRARGIPRNGETPQYVRTVLSRWSAIRSHY